MTVDLTIGVLPPTPVAADLSDLPNETHHWQRWTWGPDPALVMRLDADHYVAVVPYIFTWAVIFGPNDSVLHGFTDRWCYHNVLSAIAGASAFAATWHGPNDYQEPPGWHRYPRTGRRRDTDGNEWINP